VSLDGESESTAESFYLKVADRNCENEWRRFDFVPLLLWRRWDVPKSLFFGEAVPQGRSSVVRAGDS
jgi:hypothetical protein